MSPLPELLVVLLLLLLLVPRLTSLSSFAFNLDLVFRCRRGRRIVLGKRDLPSETLCTGRSRLVSVILFMFLLFGIHIHLFTRHVRWWTEMGSKEGVLLKTGDEFPARSWGLVGIIQQ